MKLALVMVGLAALVQPSFLLWAQGVEDRPERGVARISLIHGDVSVRRGDSGDWTAAAINAPLVVEDNVFTGPASRAEVQFDYANMIRLAGNAEVRMAELSYGRYLVQVARGITTFRVLRDSEAEVEVSTPSVSVRPLRKGIYRIHVRDDGTTEVTVRSGEAEIFTPRGTERLRSGRTLLARGSSSDPEYRLVSAAAEDDWDRWNERRDRDLSRSRSYQYVSRDIYGAEDLDDYGRWVYIPPYGWVWTPRVALGWAPYRYGRWAWIDWYGWSWVSYDPWGWAPYHYGRWFYHGPYGWCWYPGGLRSRHWWRPGLVAWVGWDSWSGVSVGVGFGFGRVGWIPLGPYEPFYPWYGRHYYRGFNNRTYIDNSVRIVNNINITNVYRNARHSNAITVVNGDDFRSGRYGRMLNISEAEVRRASLVQGQLPVAPTRENLRLADRQVRAVSASSIPNDRFFSRRAITPVDRVPFEQQRQGIEQVSRRVFHAEGSRNVAAGSVTSGRSESSRSNGDMGVGNPSEARRLNPELATRSTEQSGRPPARAAEVRSSGEGWRRIGETPRTAGETPSRISGWETGRSAASEVTSRGSQTRTSSDGWRRFGEPVRTMPQAQGRSGDSGGSRTGIGSSEAPSRSSPTRSNPVGAGSDGWRRFGEPVRGSSEIRGGSGSGIPPTGRIGAAEASPRTPAEGSSRSQSNDGWYRLGEFRQGRSAERSSGRTASPQFESAPDGATGARSYSPNPERTVPGARSETIDRGSRNSGIGRDRISSGGSYPSPERQSRWSDYGSSRSESRSQESRPSEQPVRISPPIVRERGDRGASRSGRSYDGGSWSYPSTSPRMGGDIGSRSGGSSRMGGDFGGGISGGGGRISGGGMDGGSRGPVGVSGGRVSGGSGRSGSGGGGGRSR